VSPLSSIENVPRMPPLTFVWTRFLVTDARVPSDFAIASSSTSIACARLKEFGAGFANRGGVLHGSPTNARPACAELARALACERIER
jgi:hypothetical protein